MEYPISGIIDSLDTLDLTEIIDESFGNIDTTQIIDEFQDYPSGYQQGYRKGYLINGRRYDLIDTISETSGTTIYRAIRNLEEYVIKNIHIRSFGGLPKRIQNEIEIPLFINNNVTDNTIDSTDGNASGNDTNIISIIDSQIIQNNNIYSIDIIYEAMRVDLAQYQSEQIINGPTRIFIITEILKGLSLIHLHNIIHHDLKPENILIGYNGEIKIADFGVASINIINTDPNNGTYWYMPPEKYCYALTFDNYFKSLINDKVDIWALGCIYIQLCNNGQLLFNEPYSDGPAQQLSRICQVLSIDLGLFLNQFPIQNYPDNVSKLLDFLSFSTEYYPLYAILASHSDISPDEYSLLVSCLSCNSSFRPTAVQCLEIITRFLPT
jgi:serine/threonine protein kinase